MERVLHHHPDEVPYRRGRRKGQDGHGGGLAALRGALTSLAHAPIGVLTGISVRLDLNAAPATPPRLLDLCRELGEQYGLEVAPWLDGSSCEVALTAVSRYRASPAWRRSCRVAVNNGHYRSVLLIEDEPALRRTLARNLAVRGVEVREVGSVADALLELARERPDLVLLDINLPDRSGWDVMREMRKRGATVPTIVISAVRASQSRLDEFKPLAFLPKPFPLEALLRLVSGSVREAEEIK